jgi:hypothetical protein
MFRPYSSDMVEILLVKILAVDVRLHGAGSTLNDRKDSLNLLEDESGKQRFLEGKEQKDQDTCINNCNAVLSPSSTICQRVFSAMPGSQRTSSPDDQK